MVVTEAGNPSSSTRSRTEANARPTTRGMNKKRKSSELHSEAGVQHKKAKEEESNSNVVPQLNFSDLVTHEDLWYPDGNVILVVDGHAFKLYKARLARYSSVFDDLFNNDDGHVEEYEGCPSYQLPDIHAEDFVAFLEALETPFKYTNKLPQQDASISLLKVSRLLDCATARDLALDQLRKLWPEDKPTLSTGSKRGYTDALKILGVSRECGEPSLRKRAFYELLRSAAFWKVVTDERDLIDLPDSDVLALYGARNALQERWAKLIFMWPSPKSEMCPTEAGQGLSRCSPRLAKPHLRKAFWRSDVIESGDYDAGMLDPVGQLEVLLTERREKLAAQGWCELCLKERRTAWTEARTIWWMMLDGWFDLE